MLIALRKLKKDLKIDIQSIMKRNAAILWFMMMGKNTFTWKLPAQLIGKEPERLDSQFNFHLSYNNFNTIIIFVNQFKCEICKNPIFWFQNFLLCTQVNTDQ